MSIEQSLERIADALEGIADAALGLEMNSDSARKEKVAAKTTPAKKAAKKNTAKKTPAAEPAGDAPSEDDLRLCFQEYVGKKGNEEGTAKLKELIGGYGASKIGEVKPSDFAAIITEVKSWK